MKRTILFLVFTIIITAILGVLFVVIVGAPEPWQSEPWTIWERCAQILLLVFGWPILVAALTVHYLQWDLPDKIAIAFVCLSFLASGAFWAAVIAIVANRRKGAPSHTPNGIRQPDAELPTPSM